MRDTRDREDHHTDLRTLTLTLTVSLFIALMAFFIILNSFASDNEEKLRLMRNSLHNAFGLIGAGRARVDTGATGVGTAGDMEVAATTTLRSVLPDLGFRSQRMAAGGQMMTVAISRESLEERWPELRSRLGELLVNRNPDGRYTLQLLALDGGANAADLASLAAQLEAEGVDAKLISIGFENRGQPNVELRFIEAAGGK